METRITQLLVSKRVIICQKNFLSFLNCSCSAQKLWTQKCVHKFWVVRPHFTLELGQYSKLKISSTSLLRHRCSSSGLGFLRFENFRFSTLGFENVIRFGFRLWPSTTIHHYKYCLQKANCLQFTIFPEKRLDSRVHFLHAKIVSFSARSNWEYFCENWHHHSCLCFEIMVCLMKWILWIDTYRVFHLHFSLFESL